MTSQPSRHLPRSGRRRWCRTVTLLSALIGTLCLPVLLAVPGASAQQVEPAAQATAVQEAEPRFFSHLDDLPLMAGLQEMEEANVAFDKPGGRIGEVYAEGDVPAAQVRDFYDKTLPQFGWNPVAENRFEREGEQLELEVSETQGTTTLRISLSPSE